MRSWINALALGISVLALSAAGFAAGGQAIIGASGSGTATLVAAAAGQRPTTAPWSGHSLGRGMILWY